MPLVDDVEKLIQQSALEANPKIDLAAGSTFRELFVDTTRLMLTALNESFDALKNSMILTNTSMSEADYDALLSNLFITRLNDRLTSGTARLLFDFPKDVTVSEINTITSKTGATFAVLSETSISAAVMSSQTTSDGKFFMDIQIQALDPALDNNIEVNNLSTIDGILDLVSITNLVPFTNGVKKETNDDVLIRLASSFGLRSLVREGSIRTILQTAFSFIAKVVSIGFRDAEMARDIKSFLDNSLNTVKDNIGGMIDIYINSITSIQKTDIIFNIQCLLTNNHLIDGDTTPSLDLTGKKTIPNGYYGLLWSEVKSIQSVSGVGGTSCISSASNGVPSFPMTLDSFLTDLIGSPEDCTGKSVPGAMIHSGDPALRYSQKDASILLIPKTLNGTALTDFKISVSFFDSAELDAVQTFVEADPNRVVTSDTLIKHYVPAKISVWNQEVLVNNIMTREMAYRGSASPADIKALIESTIKDGAINEISDLIDLLYSSNVDYIKTPLNISILISDPITGFSGNVSSALAAPINSTDATFNVLSNFDQFPAAGYLLIDDEIIRYAKDTVTADKINISPDGIVGDTGRGVLGSFASQHAASAPITILNSMRKVFDVKKYNPSDNTTFTDIASDKTGNFLVLDSIDNFLGTFFESKNSALTNIEQGKLSDQAAAPRIYLTARVIAAIPDQMRIFNLNDNGAA